MSFAAFASGKHALGVCDRCGLTCKLNDMRDLIVARKRISTKVCKDCWEPDNPRWFPPPPGKTVDGIALRDPRPDNKRAPGLVNIAWGWNPVYGLEASASLGTVTVELP